MLFFFYSCRFRYVSCGYVFMHRGITRLASHYGWLDDNKKRMDIEFGITASKSVQFQMRLVWRTHQIVLLDFFPHIRTYRIE